MRRRAMSYLAAMSAMLMTTVSSASMAAEATSVGDLAERTHFHGLAVDPADPSRLLLATHHGLYAVTMDGSARLVSRSMDDFMGFSPHPSDGVTLYASGHPAGGGNLGVHDLDRWGADLDA